MSALLVAALLVQDPSPLVSPHKCESLWGEYQAHRDAYGADPPMPFVDRWRLLERVRLVGNFLSGCSRREIATYELDEDQDKLRERRKQAIEEWNVLHSLMCGTRLWGSASGFHELLRKAFKMCSEPGGSSPVPGRGPITIWEKGGSSSGGRTRYKRRGGSWDTLPADATVFAETQQGFWVLEPGGGATLVTDELRAALVAGLRQETVNAEQLELPQGPVEIQQIIEIGTLLAAEERWGKRALSAAAALDHDATRALVSVAAEHSGPNDRERFERALSGLRTTPSRDDGFVFTSAELRRSAVARELLPLAFGRGEKDTQYRIRSRAGHLIVRDRGLEFSGTDALGNLVFEGDNTTRSISPAAVRSVRVEISR